MNKTRFQLPPRAGSASPGDHWETRETAAAASWSDTETAERPTDPTTFFKSVKVPFLLDIAALFAAQQRNMEAWTAANRVVWQGAQAVVRRNFEIMQQTVDGVSGSMQAMSDPACAAEQAMRQTETAIKACEDVAANVQDLREIVQQTRTDALEVLNKRFAEAAEEAKSFTRYTVREFWETGSQPASFWQVS